MHSFDPKELKKLYTPASSSNGEDNGQVTIVGGSSLFHGSPLFALKTASRVVDMVFFSSPEQTLKQVSDYIKSEIASFIWVPFDEVEKYIEKSDAALIGPGLKRFKSESSPHNARTHVCDEDCQLTRKITKDLLQKFPQKKWVIDAGSLQTIDADWIPENSIITPNRKEFELLFGEKIKDDIEERETQIQFFAEKYHCVIVVKNEVTVVASPTEVVSVTGGNAGLTKGGTGDTQAGLTTALLAKNDPFLAATCAAFVIKKSAEEIATRVGTFFNAEDVAEEVPRVLASYTK